MVKLQFMKLFGLFFCMLLSVGILQAADITVTADRDNVVLNETFQLIFTVQGEQRGEPDFSPLNKDFQLLGTSSSSRISMINGTTTRSKTYTLKVAPKRIGELVIPSIDFGVDKSQPKNIGVAEKAVTTPGTADVEDNLRVIASVDLSEPYVQQQVLLTIRIFRRIDWQQAALSDLDAAGKDLLVEQLGDDRHYRTTMEGKSWEVIERRFALFPQQSGMLEIRPFTLTAAVPDERSNTRRRSNDPFDRFFPRRSTTERISRSEAIRLQVKPAMDGLAPWLVARDLKLQENWSVDTDKLRAGESVTRTIAIIADGVSVGQLPQISPPAVTGIKSYPDQPQTNEQATSSGLLSTSSQKFALIPAHGGTYEIPPLQLKWWNVATDRMETTVLPGRMLQVSGAAIAVPKPQPAIPLDAAELKPSHESTAAAPEVYAQVNSWLVLLIGILTLLWLVTLYAWWRVRKTPQQMTPEVDSVQSNSGRRELLKVLNRAVADMNGAAARDAILGMAKHLWPDHPPVNLAQVAQLTGGSLGVEIKNLENSLYGAGETDWDGGLIVREFSALSPQKSSSRLYQAALKPMYPT